MKLKEIAHTRTGDKGEISNISVIPYREADFEWLKSELTADRVNKFFSEICQGEVVRYELPGIHAFNFVLDKTLGGGVTRSLALDKHGKTLGMALLEMEIDVPDDWKSLKRNKEIGIIPEHLPQDRKVSPLSMGKGKKIRIGSGAGYAGDRLEPALELMEKGDLDYIIFECLAERTIALGQQEREKDLAKGYNPLLAYQKKIKVITDMGAANPRTAAEKTRELADRLGCGSLKIAYVEGDDITSQLNRYYDERVLENGKRLEEMKPSLISANVYMGAEGIVRALASGADIVITGRVSDPALSIGPLVHEFGWNLSENPDQMGQAVLVGHLLECAGQVTGGYYADPGYKEVPDLDKLGFPLIEVWENGVFAVSKTEASGGLVSVDTCKEQMIYEIHNPCAYMTPDAVADFSKVHFLQDGANKVWAYGAASHGNPEKLKVSIGYKDCFTGEGEISYGGSNCMERARRAAEILKKRIEIAGIQLLEYREDFIGWNSLYKNYISEACGSEENLHEVRLRISGRSTDKKNAELLANEMEALYTNGPAGGGGAVKRVQEIVSVCSVFIPRQSIKQNVFFVDK